jgi:hypothetical protein
MAVLLRRRLHQKHKNDTLDLNMNMDLAFLVFGIFFSGYSFYAWKKYSDEEWFWLALLAVFVVFLLLSKLFLIGLLPVGMKAVLSVLVNLSWVLVLVGLSAIVFKHRRRT